MAVLMLVCFYILSWEAAETAGRFIDVSGNIKADQVILVDAGHGGVDSGMVGIGGLKEKGINLDPDLCSYGQCRYLGSSGAFPAG